MSDGSDRWLSSLPSFTAAVGATSVGMGAIYALGYFSYVGLKFLSFLNVTDFIRFSLLAMPFAFLYLLSITSSVSDSWLTAEKALNRGREERRRFFTSSLILSMVLAFVCICAFAAFPNHLGPILILSSIVFFTLIGTARTHPAREKTSLPLEMMLAAIAGGVTIAGVGAIAASSDLSVDPGRYCFVLSDKKTIKWGALLFKTDSGYIVSLDDELLGGERIIAYYPAERIDRMCYRRRQPAAIF